MVIMRQEDLIRLERNNTQPNTDNILKALRAERELKKELQRENKDLQRRLDRVNQDLTAIRFAVHEVRDKATCLAEVSEILQRAEIYRPGLFEM